LGLGRKCCSRPNLSYDLLRGVNTNTGCLYQPCHRILISLIGVRDALFRRFHLRLDQVKTS
jgi:hypothetical protein